MKLLYRTGDYAFIISAMGKLFVTVFAKPCSHDKSYQNVHPDKSLR
jgi:hypothetical protein